MSKFNNLLLLFLIAFAFNCFIQISDAKIISYQINHLNQTHPIENPKRYFFLNAGKECARAVREDDGNCTAKYQALYNKNDEKSYCCYYYAIYNCLDSAIKAKCDMGIYKNFKGDKLFAAVTEAVTRHDCPNYPTYDSCHFPLKKVLIYGGIALLVVMIIIVGLIYRHYRTGFHKVATREV